MRMRWVGNVTHREKRNAHWIFFGNPVGRKEWRETARKA